MFSGFKRAFGYVTAVTKDGVITIEGVPTYTIQGDIRRIWGTSKIEAYMFNDIGKNSFSFNAFFALDIVYAIEKILAERSIRTSRRVLHNVLQALRQDTWLADVDKEFPHKLNRERLKVFHKKQPMDKQVEFFAIYEQTVQQYSLRGMLLAAAAGSGKTLGSLMLSEMLESDVTIAVVPLNAVRDVWAMTMDNEMLPSPKYWLSVDDQPVRGNERYLVVHYEALPRFLKEIHKLKGKRINVVLDESHNFNTAQALRTDSFIQMCLELQATDVLWMSGTPIKALGSEAIPLFRSIDPLFTADTEYRFKKIFGISSTRGADILNSRLGIVSYKVEKKDLPIEEPEMLPPTKVRIPNGSEYTLDAIGKKMDAFVAERKAYYDGIMAECKKFYYGILDNHRAGLHSKPQILAYNQFREDLKVVIACGGDARFCADQIKSVNAYENKYILTELPRLEQIQFKDQRSVVKYVMLKIRGECLGRVVAKERMRAHFDMVEHIDIRPILDSSEKKTVVFTSFVEVLERLQQKFTADKLQSLTVYGKTNALLSQTLARFKNEANINPLVATYKSLSTAVPLLMADVVVLIDAPFRDYILQQTISRTSRLGATSRTTVYMFMLDTGEQPNITSRSYDILKWSQNQIEAIIGIKSPFEINEDQLAEGHTLAMEGFEDVLPAELINFNVFEITPVMDDRPKPAFMNW